MKRLLSLLPLLLLLILGTVNAQDLEILTPNGGEQFITGSTIAIVWGGIPLNWPVSIDYTHDGGITWNNVAQNVTGPRYLWEVPDLDQGVSCKLRIRYKEGGKGTPTFVREFVGHDKNANTVDISSDNLHLVSGGSDGDIVMWNINTGRKYWEKEAHSAPIILARFNGEGTLLATGSMDGTAKIWDVESGRLLQTMSANRGIVWPVGFSKDGKTLASGNDDGTISWWNVATGEHLRTVEVHNEAVRYLEYSRDGSQIYASSTDGSASIINVRSGDVVRYFSHSTRNPKRIANGIQVTPDGSLAITTGYDGWTRFWDVASGRELNAERYHEGQEASEVRISPNGEMMSSVGYNNTGRIVKTTEDGDIIFDIPTNSGLIRAAFTPDNSHVAFSHFTGRVTLWRLNEGVFVDSESEWRIEVCDGGILTGVEEGDRPDVDVLELW